MTPHAPEVTDETASDAGRWGPLYALVLLVLAVVIAALWWLTVTFA